MHRPDSTGKREKLTTRQREVLQTAYFIGFFEQPRVRTGTEIADAMGISQPTFKLGSEADSPPHCGRGGSRHLLPVPQFESAGIPN
ncbi:helix-turn-helix domain-containing protein [Halospeciosus flavus]|uniref:Helix-turn-helix domain-containing protein n=1 Tax=Halospeciosus flavus TaxID=3032283 RepID=A0ABD5Z6I8_9EURY|nr:helix-turn-helix domain-containing protein [Halospeciosus flavus]